MDLTYFAYISGVASLLGFMLQVFDVFPTHADIRKSLFLLALGIFIGTIFNAMDASEIEVTFKASGYVILVSVLLLITIIALIAGAMMEDKERRGELFAVSGVSSFIFMLVLIFGYIFSSISSSVDSENVEKSRLTTNELLLLADSAMAQGDYEREIMHLETLKNRFYIEDIRRKKLEERIGQAKDKQIK
ncbi:MAG: hypothetical protein JAZ17_25200 [Candidatus Thiodiazotropha endolucinida]|nr:hypothetical protein [Candidatus Thiodiazotropha endolucinida]